MLGPSCYGVSLDTWEAPGTTSIAAQRSGGKFESCPCIPQTSPLRCGGPCGTCPPLEPTMFCSAM